MDQVPDAASVALIAGDAVLLIQRARLPHRGLWTLPGGRLEPGEDAETAAIREIGEELGLRVGRLRPVMRFEPGAGDYLLQVFVTTTYSGEIEPADEITAFRWITRRALGELPTTPGLSGVLARAFAVAARR